MRPQLSVIIPTFNRAPLIGQAIDSVLAQNHPTVEIIVVDDGSTDDTESVVRGYGDRVRYLRVAHGGVAHARNEGTHVATGEFVTYLDSDDKHYPFTLELQARLLAAIPEAAFVCGEMSGFDDRGFFDSYHLRTYHSSAFRDSSVTYERIFERSALLADLCELPEALTQLDASAGQRRVYIGNVFDTYLLKLVLCQNSVMVRRSILIAAGPRNVAIRHWQEVDFLLRICRRHPICFVDVPTYQLRYHEGQISTTARSDGKYVWMRKQQILLRVTKRHALAEHDYYSAHQHRIDTHLAHLHRAAAVPMMLSDTAAAARLGYARRARRYLARCRRYGHPERLLWLSTFLPGPVRRFFVTVAEHLRAVAFSRRKLPVLAL